MLTIYTFVSLTPKEKGGRQNPIKNGYSPSFCVDGNTSKIYLDCTVEVPRGQKTLREIDFATINILNPDLLEIPLQENMSFTLCEGSMVIAEGIIKDLPLTYKMKKLLNSMSQEEFDREWQKILDLNLPPTPDGEN